MQLCRKPENPEPVNPEASAEAWIRDLEFNSHRIGLWDQHGHCLIQFWDTNMTADQASTLKRLESYL